METESKFYVTVHRSITDRAAAQCSIARLMFHPTQEINVEILLNRNQIDISDIYHFIDITSSLTDRLQCWHVRVHVRVQVLFYRCT